jgi:SAM-dependent methyltransferase
MDKRLPVTTLFDVPYEGVPPWEIGRPQPAFLALADEGLIYGSVLDAGCGTGELTLELATRGHDSWGVDASRLAIQKATEKASSRGISATFRQGDALLLPELGRTFDTVVDCGLFHIFSDLGRERYLASLAKVMAPGGVLHVLCFSDQEPDRRGPRHISERELRHAFRRGWHVARVAEARFVSLFHPDGARAYLATIMRVPQSTFLH